jgi:hypothetical protein
MLPAAMPAATASDSMGGGLSAGAACVCEQECTTIHGRFTATPQQPHHTHEIHKHGTLIGCISLFQLLSELSRDALVCLLRHLDYECGGN